MGVPSTRPPTPPPRQALVQVDTGQAEWQGVFSRAASTRVQAHPGAQGSGHGACGRAPSGDPSPALRVPWELYRPPWPPHPLRSFSAWPTPAGKRDQDTSLPSQGGRWEAAGTRPGSNLNREAQPARGGTVGASGRPARTAASPGPAMGRRHPPGPTLAPWHILTGSPTERGLTHTQWPRSGLVWEPHQQGVGGSATQSWGHWNKGPQAGQPETTTLISRSLQPDVQNRGVAGPGSPKPPGRALPTSSSL